MNTELRFLEKLDGSKILQVRCSYSTGIEGKWAWTDWSDVPRVAEEKDVPPENWITK